MKDKLIERLTSYVKIDTQSDASSETTPSTDKQWDLIRYLEKELKEIGMSEVKTDDKGYLMATLPANVEDAPVIGFLAHVDTATDFTGADVSPQVVEYEGGDIILNEKESIVLSPAEFPELPGYKGHTLMTTDGTTLLGADNKAGVAEIMTAMEYLINNEDIKHGKIRVAFTPDEEIGRGPHHFDVDRFGAEYAYTVDGGPEGELQYESFNAAGAKVAFIGNSVHPGTAKDKMVNAGRMASEFITMFDPEDTPEHTEGYDGFIHLTRMGGDVEKVEAEFIIRDFDKGKFEARKRLMETNVSKLREKYGEDRVVLEMNDQYYNMKDKIEPVIAIVENAKLAMQNLEIEPVIRPVRGGTDGSQLSYKGLPTPNLFTGGENFHGKFEYVSVDVMEKAVKVITEISRIAAARQ
ncbi:peptidase T [Salinicoccus halodurans]|uniref:Peptidase T n=1 Tax=Salinicoccus halodurans TaxID=407035 RepID=A0A0F7HNH1_9STAP|nr:peptidase T [Salinicoccus halodurans]AKG74692.1 peptidase T [Salinicoccus halodurans]SFK88400.1 peptidase T. Metallo peptidase. MEROPS family M20B [Salinicoccus halodurans]